MIRLIAVLLMAGFTGPLLPGGEPELIRKGAAAIDLSQLPLFPDHRWIGTRRVEVLCYGSTDTSAFREMVEFHRQQLVERGGKLIARPTITDRAAFYYFSISDFIIQMDVTVTSDTDKVTVEITNHGNVEAKSLPRNRGAKLIPKPSFPDICHFAVTPTADRPLEKVTQENHDLLIRSGWSFHASNKVLSIYRKESLLLLVKRQYNRQQKWIDITYRLYLNSYDYPPPPEQIEEFQFGERGNIIQTFTTTLTNNEISEYYRTAFTQQDWKEVPTIEPVAGSHDTLTFENYNRHQVQIKISQAADKRTVDVCLLDRLQVLDDEETRRIVEEFNQEQRQKKGTEEEVPQPAP